MTSSAQTIPEDGKEYRIWSVANHKCLTLKTINGISKVVCAGTGDETGTGATGSSKVIAREGSKKKAIIWRFVFTLDGKDYALHVKDEKVTALEVTTDNSIEDAESFVPETIGHGPFQRWELGSSDSDKKYLAVNKEDGSLSVKTECHPNTLFFKFDICTK